MRQQADADLASLAANIPGIAYRSVCDRQRTILYVSDAVKTYTGVPAARLIERKVPFARFIHPEDVARVERKIMDAVDHCVPFTLEYRLVHQDGAVYWMHECGQGVYDEKEEAIYLEGVLLDITSRKRTEEAIQSILEGTAKATGREFFHSLVHHLARTLDVHCALVGELVDGNRISTRAVWMGDEFVEDFEYDLQGTPSEDVVGQATCFYPSRVQHEFPQDHVLVKLGVQSYLGMPLTDAEGNTQGLLAVMDNKPMVTGRIAMRLLPVFAARAGAELGRRRAEEQQAKLELQLRQAQKMEAVGRLAGGIAHDFNNLLQVIHGYTELALSSIPVDDAARAHLQEVTKAARRAGTLVGQLLAFSRREVLKPEPLDLNTLVSDLIAMLRRIIGEPIDLNVAPGAELRLVLADRNQLQQVLINLCLNARDAMPDGGALTIDTANAHVDSASCDDRPWRRPGEYVTIGVADTGVGIAPDVIERIFEPFFTTKRIGEGSGLGLATVYGIVKQHDGWIDVDSEVGVGSTFRVFLPACPAAEERAAEPAATQTLTGGHETILLAEDDELVRKLTETVLTGAGYQVLSAADGDEALRLWDEHSERTDLAILDLVMPKRGGQAVYEAILAAGGKTPVLFSTGYDSGILEPEQLPTDVPVLQKPYSPSYLLRRVRHALEKP